MLVGFVIATLVAASVLFTIRANVGNTGRTQAFVAAESGRDAVRESILAVSDDESGIDCSSLTLSSTTPVSLGAPGLSYTFSIHGATGTADAPVYSSTPTCPSSTDTLVVIKSTGTAPNAQPVGIEAVYGLVTNIAETTGGSLAYFAGSVSGQKSVYTGDLVVRTGNYTCPQEGEITGDLWVLNGTASLSQKCHIGGSIFSYGDVGTNSQNVKIDEDVISNYTVSLSNNGTQVGGDIHANLVDLTGNGGTAGTVGGEVKSATTISVSGGWNVPAAQRFENAGTPTFNPTLDDVRQMTKWIDMSGTAWGQDEEILTGCPLNPTTSLPGTGRLLIDYSTCSGDVTITIGTVTLNRDVVFIVPPTKSMKVKIDGNISSAGAIDDAPQLLFVHEDRDTTQEAGEPKPTCQSTGPDDLTTTNQVTAAPHARIMVYTPCRLGGTVRVDYAGQFYVGNAVKGGDANGNAAVTFGNGAALNCKIMSWAPRLEQINCYINIAIEEGGPGTPVQTLGNRQYQTEQ